MNAPNAGGASISDILTAIKNIVIALSTEAQNFLNVHGVANAAGLTAPTLVKSSAGRIAKVSVIAIGSTTGLIYDATSFTDTSRPLYVIPNFVNTSPYLVDLPASFGIVVVPGSGQIVTVSYS